MIETLDVRGDLFKTVLHRKMAGVETVHFRIRQVSQISFSAFASEEYVILSPKDVFGWPSRRNFCHCGSASSRCGNRCSWNSPCPQMIFAGSPGDNRILLRKSFEGRRSLGRGGDWLKGHLQPESL
jgi:hypothetical protein